jgi:hypothetical protein
MPNEAITFMDEGRMFCAVSNFVKFGGVGALQHHKEMLASTLSISMRFSLLTNVTLPFPFHDVNIPLYNVGDTIGYIILWPWKLTSSRV